VTRGAIGETFLAFHTRIIQVPTLEMERYRTTRNRVALSFTPNMRGNFDRVERVIEVAVAFQGQDDANGYHKFFAFWVVEGRLKVEEQITLDRRLKEMEMPYIIQKWKQEGLEEGRAEGKAEGMERGLEEGLRQARCENARRMQAKGYSWSDITEITGIHPEDLAEN